MVKILGCTHCSKTFSIPRDYWEHECKNKYDLLDSYLLINKKYYKCYCGYKTKILGNYIKHNLMAEKKPNHVKRDYEKKINEKKYICNICDKTFKNKYNYKNHKKTKTHLNKI